MLWLLGAGEALQQCVNDHAQQHPEHDRDYGVAAFRFLMESNVGCVVHGVVSSHVWEPLIAIGTLALMYFTYGLWRDSGKAVKAAGRSAKAMEDTVAHMKDTAERDLRAYLTLPVITVSDPATWQPDGFHATGTIRNAGRTPAFRVRISSRIAIGLSPTEAWKGLPTPDDAFGPSGLLGPGESSTHQLQVQAVTAELYGRLRGGAHYLFLTGTIRYVDCFETERTTNFCRRVEWNVSTNEFGMVATRLGNDAT
jgi:hypothetical protein